MANRQGEQQALMHCERTEHIMLSEYQHNLRLCQQEGNQGTQYRQTDVAPLQHMNNFQSEELNAQRGM
eukprot:2111518-Prorocentrum_lima.AAC.1